MADESSLLLPRLISTIREWSDIIDLLTICLWVCAFVSVVLLVPQYTTLRILLGTPMVLFFPGYALISFFWPARGGLDMWERIGLSFALSITEVIVIMLILNFTQSGITLFTLLYLLSASILLFIILASIRRALLPMNERFYVEIHTHQSTHKEKTQEKALFMASLSLFTLTVLILAYMFLTPAKGAYFTQFYYTDMDGKVSSLPSETGIGTNNSILLHIVCNESAITNYTIIAFSSTFHNITYVEDWSESFPLNSSYAVARNITLRPDETFVEAFRFIAAEPGSYTLWWHLLINGEETDYYLTLKVHVS